MAFRAHCCCYGGGRFGLSRRIYQPSFVPAAVASESEPTPYPVAPASSGGSIEIEFAAGARMRITGAVDAATLKAAVSARLTTICFWSTPRTLFQELFLTTGSTVHRR
jgi:hypothetical protein